MDLTKYELARIIGARALQLSCGAPPMMKIKDSITFIEIAQMELDKNVIPLAVLKN
ncbi:DNA-directed RNA polymerase subunit K [Candidatus Micrarchaeota archaeon]|nr:DNA-directed RNA polymerase subunit K [Candidatus Micrarchaeota archaeon]